MKKYRVKNYLNPDTSIHRGGHEAKPFVCLNTGQVFSSLKEAAEWFEIPSSNPSGISSVLTGRIKTYKGLKFKYLNK